MFSEYKNILANKFMRDTNYIIIKDTDDLEELERQWELFQSCLTVRQQRLSDDRSLQIWNMTNQQHYEALKAELIGDLEDRLGIDNTQPEDDEAVVYDPEEDNLTGLDDEIKNLINTPLDQIEIPDDDNEITEPMTEDTIIPKSQKTTFRAFKNDSLKDAQANQYEIDSNINIISGLKGVTADELLADLEKQYIAWNSQNQDHRKKSDDKCREIYGMSNIDRYNKLKGILTTDLQIKKPEDTKPNMDSTVNSSEEALKDSTAEALGEFVSEVYKNMQAINEAESNANKQHRRFTDTPYFTPSEMIDMGVSTNDYFYSDQPDNDGLVTGVRTPTWFDNYKDMCMDHIFEDYTKAWIDTLDMLYSDFNEIKESGDEAKILSRKQSILNLGWNPEIPFTRRNRKLATKRVNKLLDKTTPLNLFVNLDKEVSDQEIVDTPVTENAAKDTHQPVYIVFVQGGKSKLVPKTISAFTNSDYTHVGISFDSSLKDVHTYNMVPKPGVVRETLSIYQDNIITVMSFFAPTAIYNAMKDNVMDYYVNTRNTVYDLTAIMGKAFKKNTRLIDDKYHQICSTFVDNILKSGQIDLSKDNGLPDPGQLYTATKSMPNKIIEVYSGPANKYNSDKIDKKMNKLLEKGTKAIDESKLIDKIKSKKADMDLELTAKTYDALSSLTKDEKKKEDLKKKATSARSMKGLLDFDEAYDTDNMIELELDSVNEKTSIKDKYKSRIRDHKLEKYAKQTDFMSNLLKNDYAKSEYFKMASEALRNKKDVKYRINDMDNSESNDIYHNIEDWEYGKSNVLWITGLSGSGKSTISKEISIKYNDAEHVELDNLQRAKMDNWDHTGSTLMDDYIKSKGGLTNIFSYVNDLDEVRWKDIVSNETECPNQFNDFFEYIIKYANAHKNKRFVIEGVQIAMCSKDTTIAKISKYPVIIKMNGPFKTEFRREKRTIQTGIDKNDTFIKILKTVANRHKSWWQQNFYMDDWKELNYFKTHIGESASVLNEVKQFPVEFDQEGNLIIYKARIGSIAYGDEIDDSVKLLESYRNTNNIEGMKYELAKLWFINDSIEKKLKRPMSNDQYKELINQRAICLNVFKLNLEYVMKAEKGFNFSDYYNSTPFSDNSIKITANTLKYSMKAIASLL